MVHYKIDRLFELHQGIEGLNQKFSDIKTRRPGKPGGHGAGTGS